MGGKRGRLIILLFRVYIMRPVIISLQYDENVHFLCAPSPPTFSGLNHSAARGVWGWMDVFIRTNGFGDSWPNVIVGGEFWETMTELHKGGSEKVFF